MPRGTVRAVTQPPHLDSRRCQRRSRRTRENDAASAYALRRGAWTVTRPLHQDSRRCHDDAGALASVSQQAPMPRRGACHERSWPVTDVCDARPMASSKHRMTGAASGREPMERRGRGREPWPCSRLTPEALCRCGYALLHPDSGRCETKQAHKRLRRCKRPCHEAWCWGGDATFTGVRAHQDSRGCHDEAGALESTTLQSPMPRGAVQGR